MRPLALLLLLGALGACSTTSVQSQPLSVSSPRLDSGVRGANGGGGGGDDVVGKPTGGAGVLNRVTTP